MIYYSQNKGPPPRNSIGNHLGPYIKVVVVKVQWGLSCLPASRSAAVQGFRG